MAVGAVLAASYVKVRYGALVSPLTVARVGVAAAAVYAASLAFPSDDRLAALGAGKLLVKGAVAMEFVVLGLAYLLLLDTPSRDRTRRVAPPQTDRGPQVNARRWSPNSPCG